MSPLAVSIVTACVGKAKRPSVGSGCGLVHSADEMFRCRGVLFLVGACGQAKRGTGVAQHWPRAR